MDIITEFVDLTACFTVLLSNNCEDEMIRVIQLRGSLISRQKEASDECKILKHQLDNANSQISSAQEELNEVRKLVDCEKRRRNQYEMDVGNYASLFDEIRNYIFKYDSKLNLSEETKQKISTFSKSVENLNTKYSNFHHQKEPIGDDSNLSDVCASMNSNGSNVSDVMISNVETEDDLNDSRLLQPRKMKRHTCREDEIVIMKRRKSNSILFSPTAPRANSTESLESDVTSSETRNDKCNPMLEKLNSKPHNFASKAVYKSERCLVCNKQIGFGSKVFKCTGCKAIVHKECSNHLPLPCIQMGTPSKQGLVGSLDDYAPQNPPMIPAIVIHCVNEIEQRGLKETGIYRIPGSDSEIKALKERFLKCKGVPNLAEQDIFVVCCCLKDFLRNLKDPLIPRSQRSLFAEAMSRDNKTELLQQLISKLPLVNRDTLAYLVLHLKRVADSSTCKMSHSNLAIVFGPTVVGYSNDDGLDAAFDVQISNCVMRELLALPKYFWNSFLTDCIDVSQKNGESGSLRTPRSSKNTPRTKRYFAKN